MDDIDIDQAIYDLLKRIDCEIERLQDRKRKLTQVIAAESVKIPESRKSQTTNGALPETGLPSPRQQTRKSNDFAGMILRDVATTLLNEAGEKGLSTEEMAREAIVRGYTSTHYKNRENNPEKIALSFNVILGRLKSEFEKSGRNFRLKQ